MKRKRPAHMLLKPLSSGGMAWFFNPTTRDRRKGCPVRPEPLGTDYELAAKRAAFLNLGVYAWRSGKDAPKDLDAQVGFGTLRWLVERYERSDEYRKPDDPRERPKVSDRAKPEYKRAFRLTLDLKTKRGTSVGDFKLSAVSAQAAQKIYTALKNGPRGLRLRQAEICVQRMRHAWNVVYGLYPKIVPHPNPFESVTFARLNHDPENKARAASWEEAIALHRPLIAIGEPHLAAAPLICYELHQRPENVIEAKKKGKAGERLPDLTWAHWRPSDRPNYVRVVHGKTKKMVPTPLMDGDRLFFPELTTYLDQLERLGLPIVMMRPRRVGPATPFKMRDARRRVRLAANAAGLPKDLTLEACRHGGLTELGDADVSEQDGMATTGHSNPDVFRGYRKKTEIQRLRALRKRRAWRQADRAASEQTGAKSQNGAPTVESERTG
jgi:hypothetical protein